MNARPNTTHRAIWRWKPLDPSSRWAFLRKFVIGKAGDPYIVRFVILRTPVGSVYVHEMHRPDADRDLHNHPWSFFSIVLRGGYIEAHATADELFYLNENVCREEQRYPRRRIRWTNRKRAWYDYHRITDVWPGTMTLVFAGPKSNSWGFWRQDSYAHVPWKQYLVDP